MSKNLTPLLWLENEHPELAEAYKKVSKERKLSRSREYQRKLAKAYADTKEKDSE